MSAQATGVSTPDPIKLDVTAKVSYGIGSLAVGIKDAGFKSMLLIYYNQVVGLPASKVAFAIMIALVIEAVLDPVIGYVSDNWHSRLGRRHPFMYLSAIPSALTFMLLWFPPGGWEEDHLLLYLIVSAVILRSFIALYEIPSVALVSELTSDYDARTALMSYRYYFFFTGGLILSLLTFRVFLQPDAEYPIGQLNPNGYHKYALVASAVMFVSIIVAAVGTHKYIPRLRKAPPKRRMTLWMSAKEMFETFSNKSFLMITAAGLCKSCTIGISGALNLYLFTFYWGLDSTAIAILQIDSLFSAILAAAFTKSLSKRFGKRTICMAFYLGAFLVGGTPLLLRHFGLFWENGSANLVPTLFVQGVIFSFMGMSSTILAQSMIADVVEDVERRTGRRNEGVLFSAGSLISKAISGMGVFGAGLILMSVNFPEKAKPSDVPPEMLDRLAMTYLPVAAALYAVGMFCLWQYQITRSTHEANLAALGANPDAGPTPTASNS
jgi:GPH family glycoside/pentoside/hexuronide:cation symporter